MVGGPANFVQQVIFGTSIPLACSFLLLCRAILTCLHRETAYKLKLALAICIAEE